MPMRTPENETKPLKPLHEPMPPILFVHAVQFLALCSLDDKVVLHQLGAQELLHGFVRFNVVAALSKGLGKLSRDAQVGSFLV